MFKNLEKLLNRKKIDPKQIISLIATYYKYREGEDSSAYELYFICNVEAKKSNTSKKLYVEITTTRPSVLIGEYGNNIDDLTNYLNRFKYKFKVDKIIIIVKEINIFV